MFRNDSLLCGGDFISKSSSVPVRGYVSTVMDEVSEASEPSIRRQGSASGYSGVDRKTPGSVRREMYRQPQGLRMGPDGRFRVAGATPESPLETPETSSSYTQLKRRTSAESLMHPTERFTGPTNVHSLARYSVCQPNNDENKDAFFLTEPPSALDRAAASAKWAEAHLAPRRLPDECLANPIPTEHRSIRKRHMSANSIRVHVCTSSGVMHHVELRDGLQTRVAEVIHEVSLLEPSEALAVRLEYNGLPMEASDKLSDFGVKHGDKLILQREGEVKVGTAPKVRKPVIDHTADDVLCAFVKLPLLPRMNVDSSPLQTAAGAAVAAAVATRYRKLSEPALETGWRQLGGSLPRRPMAPPPRTPPLEDLLAYLEGTTGPRTPPLPAPLDLPEVNIEHVDESEEHFQLRTPVNQYVDDATKRVILVDGGGQRAAVFPEGVVPLSAHPMRDWLIDVYLTHAPDKVGFVDRVLWDCENKEGELHDMIVETYGEAKRPYVEYVRERRARRLFDPTGVAQRFVDEQTGNEVILDDAGMFHVDGQEVPVSEHPVRQWVIDYLKYHDEERLHAVDKLLYDNQWEEDRVRAELLDEYGEAPIKEYHEYTREHCEKVSERRKRSASPSPAQEVLRRRSQWAEVDDGRGAVYYFNEDNGTSKWTPSGTPFSRDPSPPRNPSSSSISLQTTATDFSHYTTMTK